MEWDCDVYGKMQNEYKICSEKLEESNHFA